jgi:hypothetical protein
MTDNKSAPQPKKKFTIFFILMGTIQTGTLFTEQLGYLGIEIDLIYGVFLGLLIYYIYTKLPE